jgi:transcription elongation factor GreA
MNFMQKMPITKAGYEKLKKELQHLKAVAIPENARAIEEARGHGDIAENAEYQYAKERQSFLHGRMQEIENNLASSKVIDLKGLTDEKVVFGSTVTIRDTDTGDVMEYQLVGPYESDAGNNRISVTSPIGKALIGKEAGDTVSAKTPGGVREFEVVGIAVTEEP